MQQFCKNEIIKYYNLSETLENKSLFISIEIPFFQYFIPMKFSKTRKTIKNQNPELFRSILKMYLHLTLKSGAD